MPVSQKMLAANRANAKKSTGPRTKRGKDRARMNALRHGFFAHGLLLTDEDRGEFYYFREKTLKTLAPQDVVELILCERIVSATWRLRRLQTIESVTHHTCACKRIVSHDYTMRALEAGEDGIAKESPEEKMARRKRIEDEMMAIPGISEIAMGLAHGDDLMDRLSRYEMRLEMSIYRAMRQLEKLRRKRSRSAETDESAQDTSSPVVADESPGETVAKPHAIERNEPVRPTNNGEPESANDESVAKDTAIPRIPVHLATSPVPAKLLGFAEPDVGSAVGEFPLSLRRFEDLMARNESKTEDSAAAVVEPGEEEAYQYDIKIEDAGPATKKVVVQIPKERVTEKLTEQFKEIRQQAAIPGFRPGHAPQKLVEKRFGDDVKDQVRRSLLSESYQQAVEKNSLNVIGEPEFDNPEAIQLKEAEGLSYSFQIEVQPEIEIPDLKGVKVKRPKIEVNDTNVDQAMQNLREQQGTLVPVEDRGVEDKDNLVADIKIMLDGKELMSQPDAQFVSRPGRIAGVDVVDLDKQLKGQKTGETRSMKVKVPDTHPQEEVRGKEIEVSFNLKDIKRLELAEIDQPFLESLGFSDEKELREALREQMVERINYDVQQSMREQVNKHLLENVKIELPTRLSNKQTDRVVNRRAVDLMMRGIPREQIEQQLEQLRHGAKEEGVRELKLFFILQKIAADRNVDVDESELNGRIAMLAAQRGQRPEKMRQTMAKDGTLSNMYVQMREQKALDEILKDATVEDIDLQADQAKEKHEGEEKKE